MFNHLPSPNALRAFEAAARHSGFALAAEELAVSPGAISYHVKQLEDALGTPLFQRRIRQVVLTEAGKQLFQALHRQFNDLDAVITQMTARQSNTPLTVSVSTYFVTRWLSPRLGHFLNAHPDITVQLQHSVNDPDFTVEKSDIAIRWGKGDANGCHSELLIALPMIAVCSPTLLQATPPLNSVSDLRHHQLLRDQVGVDYWSEWLALAGANDITPKGPVIVDPNVRVQSAIDAQGIALANPLLQSTIDEGLLCEPFDVRLEGYGYYIVFSELATKRRHFALFRDWLKHEVSLM